MSTRLSQPPVGSRGRGRPVATNSSGWTRPTLNAFRGKHTDRPPRTGPRRTPFVLLVAGLLVGGLCALLALNTAAAAAELRRQSLQDTNAGLVADVQQLRTELAARQAPGSLASAAAGLGMVPAGNPAFIQVKPDGGVAVLGSPVPASGAPAPTPPPTTPPPTTTPTPTTPNRATGTRSQTPSHRPTSTPTQAPSHPATSVPAQRSGHPSSPPTTSPGGPR